MTSNLSRRAAVLALACVFSAALVTGEQLASSDDGSGHDAAVIRDLDCSACHTPEGWALMGEGGGGFDHARTGFPLTGRHARTSCTGCHQSGQRTVRDCSGCHRDPHQGRLGAGCDQCHNSTAWTSTRAIRRHRLSRLPLTGMHAILECRSCHVRTTERRWDSPPADCFACHEDDYRSDIHPAHEGDPSDATVTPFSRDCSICHRPTAWSPAFLGSSLLSVARRREALVRHDRNFLLSAGKHRGLDCESCHRTMAEPRLLRCTGCHAHSSASLRTSHRGRQVGGDAEGCLRCHPRGIAR